MASLIKPPEGGDVEQTVCWRLPLEDAANEAMTLLAFASRSGKTIDAKLMNPILELGRLLDNGAAELDAEKVQAFWEAYSAVVAEIQPVTSDSINATLAFSSDRAAGYWGKRSLAQKTVFKHGVCSLGVLLLIIYFQSYMQMGMSVRDHLQSSFRSQKQSIEDLFAAKIAEEDNRLKSIGQAGQENHFKLLLQNYTIEMQLAKLRASQDELYAWGKGGDKILVDLSMSASLNRPDPQISTSSLLPQLPESTVADKLPVEPSQSGLKPSIPEESTSVLQTMMNKDAVFIDEIKTVVIPSYIALNDSEQILRLISEFVLPMLYGLLGASAYVIRDLINSIRLVTFSKASMINYNLRLIMGPLVGIAVGLFLGASVSDLTGDASIAAGAAIPSSTGVTGAGSLGKAGLAFLAGYSVEVLFSALDSLVGAFARKDAQNGKIAKDI